MSASVFLRSATARLLLTTALAMSQNAAVFAYDFNDILPLDIQRIGLALPGPLLLQYRLNATPLLVAQNAQQSTLTVDNTTGSPVDVLYADQNGQYLPYQTMQDGTRLVLPGEANFVWYFGVGGQAIIGSHQMSAQGSAYLLLDASALAQAGIGNGQNQAAQPQQTTPQQPVAAAPQVTIDNTTGYDVDVLYVDQSGNYVPYQVLTNGARLTLPSQAGFVWYFGVGGQAIIGQYQTNQQPNQYFALDANAVNGALKGAQTAVPPQGNLAQQAQQAQLQRPLASAPAIPDPTVLPNGPRLDVPSVQLVGQTNSGVPFRPNWVSDTWELGQKDMRLISALASAAAIFVNQNGQVGAANLDNATSASNWYLEPTGNKDEYFFRSARDTNKYLYIDPNAANGSPVIFGETDLNAQTARWRVTAAAIGANIILNAGRPDLMMFVNNGRVEMRPAATSQSATVNDIWYVDTVADWLSVRGAVSALGQNIVQAEQDYAALLAQQEVEYIARGEAERIASMVNPYTATDPNDPGYFWVHPGQDQVDASNPAGKGITYIFDRVVTPDLYQSLFDFDTTRAQSAHLNFKPEVFAFVNNGVAYVRMKTSGVSGVELRSNGIPSSSWKPSELSSTDGTYFLAAATMQSWLQFGTIERWWPVNANTSTNSGSSSDTTKGLNLSLGEFGGDFSKSEGSSLDRQVDDYQVTGVSDRGGAKYDWQGCGLAETTDVADYCLYRSPIDLFDDDSFSLKAIKPVATSMTLMQTDTLFKLGPVDTLPDKLNLTTYIGVNLGAVGIRDKSEEELTRQRMPFGNADGFKIFYTAEAWERMFESRETSTARVLQEVVESTQTRGFQFVIELDISQLKN